MKVLDWDDIVQHAPNILSSISQVQPWPPTMALLAEFMVSSAMMSLNFL